MGATASEAAMRALKPILFALAAMLALAAPSEAQESEQRVTGHELCLRWQEQARGMFPVVCAETMTVPLFNRSSEDISDGQLVMGVYGGTDRARLAMLQIIHGMAREGKSVAIAFGPDRD